MSSAAQPDAPAVVLVEITDGAYGVAVFVFYLFAVLIVEDVGRKFFAAGRGNDGAFRQLPAAVAFHHGVAPGLIGFVDAFADRILDVVNGYAESFRIKNNRLAVDNLLRAF